MKNLSNSITNSEKSEMHSITNECYEKDRQTDGQTQIHLQTDRQARTFTNRQIDTDIYKQTQTHLHTDTQTGTFTDKETWTFTDR